MSSPARRRWLPAVAWASGVTVLVVSLAFVAGVVLPWLVERADRAGAPRVAAGDADGQRLVSRYPDVVLDQGNTITLADGRTLWIFADTAQTSGGPRFFVTSSAAATEPGSLYLDFLTDGRGAPVEFLPRTGEERTRTVEGESYVAVWPTGATELADGRVIIAYTKYVVSGGQTRFRFEAAGLYEYRPPADGDLRDAGPARRLADDLWGPGDGAIASPVAAGEWVYFTHCEKSRCYSLRAPAGDLTERGAYRWWTGSGWDHDKANREPMTYGSDRPGRNPPTAYLPDSGVYATVDTSGGIQSSTGLIWVARQPWGPWSRVAKFPLPACTSEDGCYTLNLHPGMSDADTLRVSYATAHDGPHVHVVDVPIRVARDGSSVTTGG
jgi:hypothetical protein